MNSHSSLSRSKKQETNLEGPCEYKCLLIPWTRCFSSFFANTPCRPMFRTSDIDVAGVGHGIDILVLPLVIVVARHWFVPVVCFWLSFPASCLYVCSLWFWRSVASMKCRLKLMMTTRWGKMKVKLRDASTLKRNSLGVSYSGLLFSQKFNFH